MDLELILNSLPKLIPAALVTLKLLISSLIIGLIIGLGFAILRLNKNIFINKFAYGYSYLFRGTPLLVQIFIIYYGLAQIEYLRSTFLWAIIKELIKSFNVTNAAGSNFGKLFNINSKSILIAPTIF